MVTAARAHAASSSSLKLHYIFVFICCLFTFLTEACIAYKQIHALTLKKEERESD